jgi:sugar fermentation stimulation protein A
MQFDDLIEGVFITRENRFLSSVMINGVKTYAHLANSGKLPGLLSPGTRVWLTKVVHPNRKTKYDLTLVKNKEIFVSVDSRLPNILFEEAIHQKRLDQFASSNIRHEVRLGASRIDLLLTNVNQTCWVETKSVTLVEKGVAKFPDSPTKRGQRHLLELINENRKGNKAVIAFIILRNDPVVFSPNWLVDVDFSRTLKEAKNDGVEIHAYTCQVSPQEIYLEKEIESII